MLLSHFIIVTILFVPTKLIAQNPSGGYGPGGGSGGGITSVSSLPATCTPGTTANVTLSVAPFQEYQCGPLANQWFPFNPSLVISPISYGAKWDVKAVTDATFTNTSNTVTCPNSDCNFTSADLGKIVFGTTFPASMTIGCNGASCGSVILPQGFICTINNANSIAVGTTYPACAVDNATGGCTGGVSPNCALLWGTQDDSAAINAAAAAAWTATSCKTLMFPSGMAFFTVPSGGLLNVTVPPGSPCAGSLSATVGIADITQQGAQVAGQGSGTSVLVPLPTVNFANCTGGHSGTACIAGPPNWFAHDWGVWGFGQADNGTTHANDLIEFAGVAGPCTATAAWNMSFSAWETSSVTSKGFNIGSGCAVLYASNIVSEAFGNTNCSVGVPGAIMDITALDCFGSSGSSTGAASMVASGLVNSTGGFYWGVNQSSTSSAALELVGSSATLNSFGDDIQGPANGNNNFTVWMNAINNTVTLSGSNVNETNTSGVGDFLFFCPSSVTSCTINSYASQLTASGAHMAMFFKTGTPTFNFFDACSNTFTQGGVANSPLNVYGTCSITGTTLITGNVAQSAGWGTTAAISAPSGDSHVFTFTVTSSGTGQAANPTLAVTFPTAYLVAPSGCSAIQIGGTGAIADLTTTTGPSATAVTYTWNATPVAASTYIIQGKCQ